MSTEEYAFDCGGNMVEIRKREIPSETETLKKRLDDVAKEIGQSVVDHLKLQYPAALQAVTKTAQLSLRNHVRNQINWKMRPLIKALDALNEAPPTPRGGEK